MLRTKHIATIFLHIGEQDKALLLMAEIAATLDEINQSSEFLSISQADWYADFLEAYDLCEP
jgi:hypothetical protein